MCRLAFLLLFASTLSAADDRLAGIHALLAPMRSAPFAQARGATPALTEVKHQLLDWIETHLADLKWEDARWTPNPAVLEERLDDELSVADLLCPQTAACRENRLGYLDRIALDLQSGFLVVRTSLGIQTCGADDSAYIYESTDDRWHLMWQSEQNNYDDQMYFPQRLVNVEISPTDWRPESDHTEHLIVTTGVYPWRSSVWQPIYYRVWQAKSSYSSAILLLDGTEQADIASPIHARANHNDAWVEFQVIADDAMRVSELRHYVLENGKLHRTDPVALTPQDFVSFWLRHPWAEVLDWTDQNGRATLKAWRQKYKGTDSEFASPARRCTLHPDLWQVVTEPDASPQADVHYFLVRARPPFRFTMLAASERPWRDCTAGDPAIDNAANLFDK